MDWLTDTDPRVWGACLTRTAIEIVLGIDNIVFGITAVGMAQQIAAVVVAVLAMTLPRTAACTN